MRHVSNLRRVSKIVILCTFTILTLVSGNTVMPHGASIIKNNTKEQSDESTQNIYNRGWQFISRARYVRGTIVSLKKSPDGKYILNLKVEVNYHNETDPIDSIDFPFKIGDVVEFTLKEKPKINFKNFERIIIYQGLITTNGKDSFLGASIKYYKDKDKYLDMNGKEITLPPQDYTNRL